VAGCVSRLSAGASLRDDHGAKWPRDGSFYVSIRSRRFSVRRVGFRAVLFGNPFLHGDLSQRSDGALISGRFLPDLLSIFSAVVAGWVLGALVATFIVLGPSRTTEALTRWPETRAGFGSICVVAALLLLGGVRWVRWARNCADVSEALEKLLDATAVANDQSKLSHLRP
jgi:hypothetical protein